MSNEALRVIISRTDAIGDVVLTLPMCGFLKEILPGITIYFLGRSYTKAVIECCTAVDHFINYDELRLLDPGEQVNLLQDTGADVFIHVFPDRHLASLARIARIKTRIGTRNRIYHWFNCTKLVKLSRKKSSLHEAELNLVLLGPLYSGVLPKAGKLHRYYRFTNTVLLPPAINELLSDTKFNLVIHPKSRGNGKEWSLDRYAGLISLLPEEHYRVFISGSEKEKAALSAWITSLPKKDIREISGLLSLDQLISFFHSIDGLIASGTGPLHLAAASGVHALGLFPPTPPIHPGRWAPLGEKAEVLVGNTEDTNSITSAEVYKKIRGWKKK